MTKEIVYSEDNRKKIQAGVDRLANAVKVTLGPKGRNAVIQKPAVSPLVTNDGATIAKEIDLEGNVENMGAQLIKEVAAKTNDLAGDGTTTAIVLAQCIIREGFKNIAAGANPIEMKMGIQGAVQLVVAAIKKLSKPIEKREDIAQIAAISSDDPFVGEMIAEAMEKVGTNGVITVDDSQTMYTTLKILEGMQFEKGYLSPYMVTDKEKMVAELVNPYILITDRKISNAQELLPLLEQVIERGRSLLIIAEGLEEAALGMLVMNKMNGKLNVVAVNPPAYGDGRRARMDDLAILTGGIFITENMGYVLRDTTVDMLGSAASVRVEKQRTIISGGAGNEKAVATRIANLRQLSEKSEHDFDKKQLEERLAKLSSGVAVISVGAPTDSEMKEKKLRIEDAIHAAKAAVAEGIVAGGGIAYVNIIPAVKAYVETLSDDRKTGAAIILRALEEPARQIAENAGLEASVVIAEVLRRPAGIGFNVLTEEYINMRDAGIVDSAKVTRLALQNAASVSALLLTIEAGVANTKA